MTTDEGLKREVGLWGLTANIINGVIGSGIFVLPAIVSEGLGSAGLLAYLFCGVLVALIMLCFAELSSKIPVTGGAYAYIELAFGKYAGFLTTNLFVFGASLMAAAAVANALADTLSYLLPFFNNYFVRSCFFLLLFCGLAIVNIIGIKQGITLVKVITIMKLLPIVLLILCGFSHIQLENFTISHSPTISDFGKVSVILFFAFQGAESSLTVGGEVKRPNQTFPRAIFFGFLLILAIYITVQLVAQGLLGSSFPNYKAAPLAEVARRIIGPLGITIITVGAAVSMFGLVSSIVMNMPRVLFRSSLDGAFPIKQLARIHPTFQTPYISIIVFTALTCLFAVIGNFRLLALLASASVLLIYLGVAAATLKLKSFKSSVEHFTVPGGYFVPIAAILVILWFLASIRTNEKIGIIVFITLLTVLYFALKYFKLIGGSDDKKEVRNEKLSAANNPSMK